jgi:hypothetical protein
MKNSYKHAPSAMIGMGLEYGDKDPYILPAFWKKL